MSNVINKSNHPVEIKKISVSMWTLRDEIETAIAERLKDKSLEEVDIEDIKEYYTAILNKDLNADVDEDDEDERQDGDLDSSGNPMDDDAAAMMAALQGGGDDEDEKASEDESEEEDDEAAKLAAEMMADQKGGGESESSEEDDEAAKLAADMLADQMGGEADEEAPKVDKENFKRTIPSKDKQVQAYVMLSDLNMETMLFFSMGKFIQGQNIVVKFNIPSTFTVFANVQKCMDISRNSKLISKTKPSHRIHTKLEFRFPGERDNLRKFLKSIEPTIPATPKKIKRPDSDDEDDDFEDLGF